MPKITIALFFDKQQNNNHHKYKALNKKTYKKGFTVLFINLN